MEQNNINTFNVILVGDGGVGKTTFVKQHLTEEFEKRYIATVGVDVHPKLYNTTEGQICFNIWDMAGQEKFGGVQANFYRDKDCAIIMFDVTSEQTYKNVKYWHTQIVSNIGNIPTIVVGNKIDSLDRTVVAADIKYPQQHNLPYCEISVKANNNITCPFFSLAQMLI